MPSITIKIFWYSSKCYPSTIEVVAGRVFSSTAGLPATFSTSGTNQPTLELSNCYHSSEKSTAKVHVSEINSTAWESTAIA
jgi:hypothetical protein